MSDQEGARKSGKFIVVSLTPDVCWTPVGSTMVPVPYMITADLSDSLGTEPTVRFGGEPVFLHDKSKITHVTGDEAGTGGGVVSGTYKGIAEPIEGSASVRVNDKAVVRHGDRFKMNNGNTIGRLIYQGPNGGAPNTDSDTNPPIVPQTPAEEQAAREGQGLWALIADAVHGTPNGRGFVPSAEVLAALEQDGVYRIKGQPGKFIRAADALAPTMGDVIEARAIAAEGGAMAARGGRAEVIRELLEWLMDAAEDTAKKETKKRGKKTGQGGVRITGKAMKLRRIECFRAGETIPADKHGEFDRQLQRQEDALNEMTVDEYLKGREAYGKIKRKSTRAARKEEQERLAKGLRKDYQNQRMSVMEAEKMADARSAEIMEGLAALHEPDLQVGGKDVIGGFGDAQVNKSIGAGWKGRRVKELDAAAKEVSTADRGNTRMNVKLERCK